MNMGSSRPISTVFQLSKKSLLLGSAAAFVLTGAANAQTTNDSEEVEESNIITVIARKQSESLQDVPVTVQAVTGETLDDYAIDRFEDIAARIPSLSVNTGGSGSGGSLSLRGIGSSPLSAAFDSAVAFDLDGVQISTLRLVQSGFMDLAQIDVLKGPQSLFFGKSASGGVVALRSANPTSDFEIGAKASYELEKKGWIAQGYVSGPISDSLGFRIAGRFSKTDAIFDNYAPGATNSELGEETEDVRVTLAWDPSDDFTANLKLSYSHFEDDGPASNIDIFCGLDGQVDTVLVAGAIPIPGGYDCDFQDGRTFVPDIATVVGGSPPQPARGLVPFNESEIFFGRLKWDWDINDSLTLSSVTGFLDLSAQEAAGFSFGGVAIPLAPGATDFFGTPVGQAASFGPAIADNSLQQFSQEFRITSDMDGPFNFMLGAFYENRQYGFLTSQSAVGGPVLAQLLAFPGFGPNGEDPATGFTYDWLKEHITKTNAYSLFGSVTYELSDRLEFSGGVRWTKEDKTNTIDLPYVHAALTAIGFAASGQFFGPIKFDDSNFSPEASLTYKVNDDINVYAAFKTGFKSGGIDNSALPSGGLLGLGNPAPDPNDPQGDTPGVVDPNDRSFNDVVVDSLVFDSETSIGGEIGFKGQFANRTFTLNASIFYYVFDDLQVQNFNSNTIQFNTGNASQLTSQGIDIDFAWRPDDIFTISGSVTHADTEFTKSFVPDPINFPNEDLLGRQGRVAPGWTGNIAADARIPLGDSFELGLGGNAKYSGSYFINDTAATDFTRTYIQPSYWTFDANISVGDPEDKWKLSLIGVNIGNEYYANFGGLRPFGTDDQSLYLNRGRQIFVEAAFKF